MSTPIPRLNLSTIPSNLPTACGAGGTITPDGQGGAYPNRRLEESDDVIWSHEGRAMGGGAATPPPTGDRPPSPKGPMPRTNAFPDQGNFSGHPDHLMLKNMYDAITRLNLWGWLTNFTPEEGKGFMFSAVPEIQAIGLETDGMGHSGASFAVCMRHMEKIAKGGWIDYYREIIAPKFATK
jgi:hypothetical protein